LQAVGTDGASVDEITLEARRRGFDPVAARLALTALSEASAVVIPLRPPARDRATRREVAAREIEQIRASLAVRIEPLLAHERLAAAYDVTGARELAARHHRLAAETLEERNRLPRAIDQYRKALKQTPRDLGIRRRVMELFERLGRTPDAVHEGLRLARTYREYGLVNRARHLFSQLVGLRHDDPDLRRELIEMLIRVEAWDEAVHQLEDLGALYARQNERRAFLACQQTILRLAPGHEDAARHLRRVARRSRAFVRSWCGVGVLAVLAVTVIGGSLELNRVAAGFERARADAKRHLGLGAGAEAEEAIRSFEASQAFPSRRIASVRETVSREVEAARSAEAAATLHQARRLEARGDAPAAQRRYLHVQSEYADTPFGEKALRHVEGIRMLDEAARALHDRLAELNRAPKPTRQEAREALEIARHLAATLPWADATRRSEVAFQIESLPEGASVLVNGRPLVGRTTPCVVRQRFVPGFTLTFSKRGFLPASFAVDLAAGDVGDPIHVELHKPLRWRYATRGPITLPPTILSGSSVVFGSTDGGVYAVNPAGKTLWTHFLPPFSALSSAPVVVEEVVVLCEESGRVSALSTTTGATLWRRDQTAPHPCLAAAGRDGILFLAHPQRVAAHKAFDGATLWEHPLEGPPLAPVLAARRPNDWVLVRSNGTILRLHPRTGKALGPPVPIPQGLSCPPALSEAGLVVATRAGNLGLVDLETGAWKWKRALPSPATLTPAIGVEFLYVATADALLSFRLATGSPGWATTLPDRPTSAPTLANGRIYAGTEAGRLLAADAETGRLLWSQRTAAPVVAPPVVHRGVIYLASSDFSLYALEN
jgi:outer membrane protein assembly factor BamB/tetratricopeptide (TPR) repeat protein